MSQYKLPTEVIQLPSRGLLYSKESPLSSGSLEMKYMTAKEEDILTNQSYIRTGVVIDKLLESLIVTPNVNYGDLLVGDKNSIMVAARVLSYGKDYEVQYRGRQHVIDLSTLKEKAIDYSKLESGKNEFTFDSPTTSDTLTFKILTHRDETSIEKEVEGLKKINKDNSKEVTTRLKHMITSVNGERGQAEIREYIDNYLLAKDARALRELYSSISPDVDLTFYPEGGEEGVSIPIGIDFFFPDL